MPRYEVDVNYSYRIYEGETVTVTVADEDDIDEDMIETVLRKQHGFHVDDELQIDDFYGKVIS